MNYYALVVGILVAVYVVYSFKRRRLESKKWAYPVLLATFPGYYWVFAVYAADYEALIKELAVGLGFLLLAYVTYRFNSAKGLCILALGYIAHGVYDVVHDDLFHNAGTPLWWPEFCGAVDVLLGLYLIYLATTINHPNSTTKGTA